MASVTHSGEFCAALEAYYAGGSLLDGAQRVKERFPADAERLVAEVQALHRASRGLPGLWGREALPLTEACDRIDMFIEAEYPFVPAPLRNKIVDALSYELWK